KFRLYFAWWLNWKYKTDTRRLLKYYHWYHDIEEGISPYLLFSIAFLDYNWDYAHYRKITWVLLYLQQVELIDPEMSTLSNLRLVQHPSVIKRYRKGGLVHG